MSSLKLGFAVAWSAFWTGAPFKFVIALLFLAMGVHPWEGSGLAFLLLLSIPIDWWAIGLTAKTVFIEKLRLEPPDSVGLTLWWQIYLVSAVYFPVLYFVESGAIAGAKAVTHKIMTFMESVPVAEKISIELVLWGSVATVVLIFLILGWVFIVGQLVKRQAAIASPSGDSYQGLVRKWDLMRVPADQALVLTVSTAVGVFLVFCFWGFLPATTPHPHEDYEQPEKVVKPLKPEDALKEVEQVLAQAEFSIDAIEKDKEKSPAGKKKAQAAGQKTPTIGTKEPKAANPNEGGEGALTP